MAAAGLAPGAPRRLAATAVEIGFEGAGDPRGLAPAAVDANIVPAEGRRKRLLIADMDSTIIGVECIDELADFAGVKPAVAAITEAAMRGELDFEGALRARVGLLAGLPETVLAACYAERVRLNPGARVLVRTMAALGADTALISGGFDFFTARVAAEAGFAANQANRLGVADGLLSGTVAEPILGRAAKRAALAAIAAQGGYAEADAVAVGDGANDLDMIAAAGLGVAYRAKPALAEVADARLDRSDLTAILALQGIPESDWVA
ncbi:MAG: phosphoserine phosphatase SerB [Amaricoccus sp.]|nr:phosphoserine phosphatase SerB [Amaricoccus sp.]